MLTLARGVIVLGAVCGFGACLSASDGGEHAPVSQESDPRTSPSGSLAGASSAGSGAALGGGSGGAAAGGSSGRAGGNAGVGGFVAHCAAACVPLASIRADFPASLGAARQGTLKVCRNAECYSAELANVPDNAGVSLGPPCFVSVDRAATSASLQLSWSLEALGTGFANGDRYQISVVRAAASEPVRVFDEMIDYTTVDYCDNGTCLEATIDARGSLASGGEGGEGGAE